MGGFGWREEEAWWAVSLCIIWRLERRGICAFVGEGLLIPKL